MVILKESINTAAIQIAIKFLKEVNPAIIGNAAVFLFNGSKCNEISVLVNQLPDPYWFDQHRVPYTPVNINGDQAVLSFNIGNILVVPYVRTSKETRLRPTTIKGCPTVTLASLFETDRGMTPDGLDDLIRESKLTPEFMLGLSPEAKLRFSFHYKRVYGVSIAVP